MRYGRELLFFFVMFCVYQQVSVPPPQPDFPCGPQLLAVPDDVWARWVCLSLLQAAAVRRARRTLMEAPSWHPSHFAEEVPVQPESPNPNHSEAADTWSASHADLAEMLQTVRIAQAHLHHPDPSTVSAGDAAQPPAVASVTSPSSSSSSFSPPLGSVTDLDFEALTAAARRIQAGGKGTPRPIGLWNRTAHEPFKLDKEAYVKGAPTLILLIYYGTRQTWHLST